MGLLAERAGALVGGGAVGQGVEEIAMKGGSGEGGGGSCGAASMGMGEQGEEKFDFSCLEHGSDLLHVHVDPAMLPNSDRWIGAVGGNPFLNLECSRS